jgi:hypothetical protein
MFELKEIDDKLEDFRKTMKWLIAGMGVHGLKLSDIHTIDWEWVCENYNVSNYSCKHNNVTSIGMVIGCGESSEHLLERFYDGYCEACNKHVYGRKTLSGETIERWK